MDKPSDYNRDDFALKHIDVDLAYDIMSTPTVYNVEYRLVTYIILWARRHNIAHEIDKYGNVYLTKGEVNDGEYYPCVTSHLDTVQTEQEEWAKVGLPLDIITKVNSQNKHEWHVDGMGIGADCKSGVVISLSLFNHFDKIKGCFFLEEEIGCLGSKNMNTDWFKDVGYVIGYDSPELNRAAWSCSGVKLFDKTFFQEKIQTICADHGLTIFNSEPFTDVKTIREKTDLICMNFGNGGYNPHSNNEYCVVEDMDHACGMGIDIIKSLGNKQYKLENKTQYGHYEYDSNGVKRWVTDADYSFFKDFSGYKYSYGYYNKTKSTTTNSTSTTTQNTNMEDLEYVVELYEDYIDSIKTQIEGKCKELNIDFNEFNNIFNLKITC